MLFKALVVSQFNYCSLVWMFSTRELNSQINNLHEKTLRVIYKERVSSFDELLKTDKSVSIHHGYIFGSKRSSQLKDWCHCD